jgi:hypothetical protein
VYEQADPGSEYIITRYRQPNCNLRTQLQRIIQRAGLKPWPKLFHNLRATRETELAERFPIHVVCAWIGNSERIAQRHYLQVTDDHFAQAADLGEPLGQADDRAGDGPCETGGGAKEGALRAQKAAQPISATVREDCEAIAEVEEPTGLGLLLAGLDAYSPKGLVELRGLEPRTCSLRTNRSPN